MFKRIFAMAAAALAVVGILQLMPAMADAEDAAVAADLSVFDPGRIIDDSIFFNGSAMTAQQVQAFLVSKRPTCSNGYTCLKDLRIDTTNKSVDPMCRGYVGTAYESAADIIAKVGQSCGVSPKVLIVMLQKEQGLVTSSAPSSQNYRAAMGMACPDTAPCDAEYYGFFNQVYGAAQALVRYTQPAGTGSGTSYYSRYDLMYPVGQTSNVPYHPNSACGTKRVTIANQATHALYVYTPYTPNAAALASAYGVGDSCSAYGNRNFFTYFSDWFGATRGPEVGSAFVDYYATNSSWLGFPLYAASCDVVGCRQQFSGGMVFSGATTGVHGARPEFLAAWGNQGREYGPLGLPTSERLCDMGGGACRQEFQGGWLVQSDRIGFRLVANTERAVWGNWGREYGMLGLPIADRWCTAAICVQQFDGGWMVTSSATGTQVVPNAVRETWGNWGREFGMLGLPSGAPSVPGGSSYTQAFQGGVVTVTNNVAVVTSSTDPWWNAIVTSPWLGAPTAAQSCTLSGGACFQSFAGGWVVKSPSGAYAVPNAVRAAWGDWGREYGILGFPTAAPSSNPTAGNYTQNFQGGVMTVTGGVAKVTSSSDPWWNAVLTSPWLGTANAAQTCSLGGGACYQDYQGGWVVKSPAGAFAVPVTVRQTWGDWGREYGILGFPAGAPSANPASGNYTQPFQGGVMTVTSGSAKVTSSTDPWWNAVLTSPWLGSANAAQSCNLGGGACYQDYQGGWVIKSQAGSFALPTAVRVAWGYYGREYGSLGFPTGAPSANPTSGAYTQGFQGGSIAVSNGVASVHVN
ncbi:LGFP repeat-containing protein [Naasia lichenicola]|nr:hypothetical protein [Naasia lichenicola]